jgi:hypothetical protein
MKFQYQFIKENLRIYEVAKSKLPIIGQYERGEVTYQSMQKIGLDQFAQFFNFLKSLQQYGFEAQMAINYTELKSYLIDHTRNSRFKTWLKNRSQKQFKHLLEQDPQTFDRLLNGRWISKPGYTYRGRRSWGRRSVEYCEGLDIAFIPLINWIISNDIDVSTISGGDVFSSFSSQSKYSARLKWYLGIQLDIDAIPYKEIEVTSNLLESILDFVVSKQIDFRKLNSDFIIDTFQNKIRSLMSIPEGVSIRCRKEIKNSNGMVYLTPGNDYSVENTTINSGFLRVCVMDDTGLRNWYDYSNFEDKSIDRDLLLTQLGIF